MRHIVDPRQERLFDPFQGLFSALAVQILGRGWQGVFRHVILQLLPVAQVAEHFHPSLGAPTKELYSMAGLVFLADFHNWTAAQAAEAYMFRTDVQYALNLDPGAEVSPRTVERYQKIFRGDHPAGQVFDNVTTALAEKLELDVSRQRLDSTHVFSHMATFGRTKLMAAAVKRFLTQARRHAPQAYAQLPAALRDRYEPAEARLFAGVTDAESRQRSRQQAAEDLLAVIEHFADEPRLSGRPTYAVLQTIFDQQCAVAGGKVVVRAKTGGARIQNPSDPDASYDGHKGPGYQVRITETCSPDNEVQLITAGLPQTACEGDEAAVAPMLDQLQDRGLSPVEMTADALYGGDDNVQAAAARGVELIAPVPGRTPEVDPAALSLDDFALDERTGLIDACPTGHPPVSRTRDEEAGRIHVEMPAAACEGCPDRGRCPISKTRDGRFTLHLTDREYRLAGRRREQETEVFKQRYTIRSGIESTNSGLKNRLGLKRLRVRGRGSVFRVIQHKLAGWNVPRAAASRTLRAWVAQQVARVLKSSQSSHFGGSLRALWQCMVSRRGGSPALTPRSRLNRPRAAA